MGMTPITLSRAQQLAVLDAIGMDSAMVEDNGVQLYRTDDPDRVALRVTVVATLDANRLADAL